MNKIAAISPTIATEAHDGFKAREFMHISAAGAFDFAGKVELIDGVIIKMAPAGMEHAATNFSVAQQLAAIFTDYIVAVDLAIEIDERTILGIDVAVSYPSAPRSGAVAGVDVHLAVEIASTTLAKDLAYKGACYAGAGIPHYWVVDTEARVVHVMGIPESGGYRERGVVRFGEPLMAPGGNGSVSVG